MLLVCCAKESLSEHALQIECWIALDCRALEGHLQTSHSGVCLSVSMCKLGGSCHSDTDIPENPHLPSDGDLKAATSDDMSGCLAHERLW